MGIAMGISMKTEFRSLYSIGLVAVLLLGGAIMMISPQSKAEINGPVLVGPDTWVVPAGDWIIENGDNIVHGNKTIYVESGNVLVLNGGTLTLYNVTLQVNCSAPGEYRLEVQDGGAMYVYDGGDGMTLWDAGDTDFSVIRGIMGLPMNFRVLGSGVLHMENSSTGNFGQTPPSWPLPYPLQPYGLYTESDNTYLRNVAIVFAGGVIANGSSPTMIDSATIFNQFGIAGYNNADPHLMNVSFVMGGYPGVYLDSSSITFETGSVAQMGQAAPGFSGIQTAADSYAYVEGVQIVQNAWGGIWAEDSHLDLYDSNVSDNDMFGVALLENQNNLLTSNIINNTFSRHTQFELVADSSGDTDLLIDDNVFRTEPLAVGTAIVGSNNVSASLSRNNFTGGDDGLITMANQNISLDMSDNWFGDQAVSSTNLQNFGGLWLNVSMYNNSYFMTEMAVQVLSLDGEVNADLRENSVMATNDAGIVIVGLNGLSANVQDNEFMAIGMAPSNSGVALYLVSLMDMWANVESNDFLFTADSAVFAIAMEDIDLTLSSNSCLICSDTPFMASSSFQVQALGNLTAYVYNNSIDFTTVDHGMHFTVMGQWATMDFVENTISNTDQVGMYLDLIPVSDVTFESNDIGISNGAGIYMNLPNFGNVALRNNTLSRHAMYGFGIMTAPPPIVVNMTMENNFLIANGGAGTYLVNVDLVSSSNVYIANGVGAALLMSTGVMELEELLYNDVAIVLDAGSVAEVINSTAQSAFFDFIVDMDSHLTTLNTTMHPFLGYMVSDALSTVTVKWFMHISVITEQGAPVPGATVDVVDALATPLATRTTGPDGMVKWLVVNQSFQMGGTRVYYTPHNVTASGGGFGTGYADPDMDMSKTVVVVLTDIQAPVAMANDQIVDEDAIVLLDSAGSSDNVGIVNWTWVVSDVGGNVTVYGENAPYVFAQPGIYTVTLTVFDAAGLNDTDMATYTVNDVTDPIANAGPDQTVNSTDVVNFDGTASTDNVGITNFTWMFTYDGSPVGVYGATPSFTFITPGVYDVVLTVMDAGGNSNSDTVTITVEDNEAPVADAGADDLNNNEGTTVNFDGTASTDNVGIVSYMWEFDYDGNTIVLEGDTPSFTFNKVGTYEVTLTVEDAAGNSGTDTMTVGIDDSTPPEVVATSPADGAGGVSIETEIVITFSEAMDTGATEGAITVSGATIKEFEWNSDDTQVTITLEELEFDTEYTITVTDTATDAAGNALSDETFAFTTHAPPPIFDLANDFYWLIILIILVVIIVILALRKGKAPEAGPTVYEPVGYEAEAAPPAEEYPVEEPYEAPPEEPMEPMPEEPPEDIPPEPEGEELPEEPPEEPED
jgi:PKD repeat protein